MNTAAARHVIVVGAGWAGLAAAVRLVQRGHRVTVLEMAPQPGGRARSLARGDDVLDNGQHILIGAYTETLALMKTVGADPSQVLRRLPLTLRQPGRHGLQLPDGPAVPAFVRGVLACRDWTWGERLALLRAASAWALRRFRCPPTTTVSQLCAGLPPRLRADLIEPLCVAALNTPAEDASAQVLLRVLRDALFSGPGAADLLLPRVPLDQLLPRPAVTWLQAHAAVLQFTHRVTTVARRGAGWTIDGEPADAVVLAASAPESARLVADLAPDWAALASAFAYEPIVTVYADAPGARLDAPMLALPADDTRHPAQFVFDLSALGGPSGRLAFVISGAANWVAAGRDAIAAATQAQARSAWPGQAWADSLTARQVLIEKRATFRCTPGLARPAARLATGLWAAGDFIEGPYPATLEGAVRSGLQAADGVIADA
ncbi:hydroxysqualene dehydroxylase HpnE [Rubrivivax albus]|uniref:FAD-dependent oxidoreductase n=1 Tax=Rubrivivax albus TaxID=2499835 RepID=A0A437K1G5_9BURK|nr:hydroxysqualene dehydroxylase HpnE [Rubrivivax albus]RVT54140.1 FAD-dependent oxidoreductase [Rubrivivax albus]